MKNNEVSKVFSKIVGHMVELLLIEPRLHRVTKYIGKNLVVNATIIVYKEEKKLGRRYKNNNREDIQLKIGSPNYKERLFIKKCIKAGEEFPVRKLQLKYL